MKTTLIIMAAGIGSRFGTGIKQLAKMSPNGEIIMDYSIYDAKEAGFDKVVFIIRKDIEEEFRSVIGNRIGDQIEVEYVYQDLADIPVGTQLTADFEILATSRPVLEEVIEKLNLDYTYEELKSMIQTDNQTDTRILRFTVSDANAKEAKKIANELADVTAERVAYVMSSDKPKVVEEAVVPKYPSSPNTKKNTAMGGLAFAFVAATVIVLRYLMNDTIQTEEDIKKYLGLHMLAAIPTEKRESI